MIEAWIAEKKAFDMNKALREELNKVFAALDERLGRLEKLVELSEQRRKTEKMR